ncbi:MAG: UDP-N-acetylmuramate--L-alanine ligase [Candidatus Lightella neohaematopini]|nr:UDP-N-acetylmuramate--L-alanine ligase [Candidatus Lightella neohaematopini]
MINLSCIKNIHLIGIGGIGMSGIAKILILKGYKVSGSDLSSTVITKQLISLGVNIIFYHHKNNIINANLIVFSNAISHNNPEILAAKKLSIPIISRVKILSLLMKNYYNIIVSGTHGKTTTTALIYNILKNNNLQPTVINGGLTPSSEIYSYLGNSKYFIVESDESHKSFMYLNPTVAIITNIDDDHLRNYGSLDFLKKTFISFLNKTPVNSYIVLCTDSITVKEIHFSIGRNVITYGFNSQADFRIVNYHQYQIYTSFIIKQKNGININISTTNPGYHNALNITAAVIIAIKEKIRISKIIKIISKFCGVNRRFSILGKYNINYMNKKIKNIILIDDYGHHPTELKATINTVRIGWPNRRIIMIFQPHRFTRTYDLYNDFINVLSSIDITLILAIYSAGEKPIKNFSSKSLCMSLNQYSKTRSILILDTNKLISILISVIKDNDVIIIQGAGTISNIATYINKYMIVNQIS